MRDLESIEEFEEDENVLISVLSRAFKKAMKFNDFEIIIKLTYNLLLLVCFTRLCFKQGIKWRLNITLIILSKRDYLSIEKNLLLENIK